MGKNVFFLTPVHSLFNLGAKNNVKVKLFWEILAAKGGITDDFA